MKYLVGLLLIFPLALAMDVIVWHGVPDGIPAGDAALLEIATRAALKGQQLTGPYSRAGFDHPGPLYFYLLAPLYWLTGQHSASLHLTALLINLSAIIGMLLIIWRHARQTALLWFALLLAIYLLQTGSVVMSIWNPHVTILPFLLVVFSFSAVAAGQLTYLPLAIVTASFVIQTHLGYTVALVAIGGCSIILGLSSAHRTRFGCQPSAVPVKLRPVLVLALGVLGLLWCLPFIEQFTHTPGNLTKIVRNFTQATDHLSWQTTIQVTCDIFATYTRNMFSLSAIKWNADLTEQSVSWLVYVISAGQFAALGVSAIHARRQQQEFFLALAVNCMILSGAILLSINRISGDIFDYLILWMTSIGMILWFIIGGVFLPGLVKIFKQRLGQPAARIALITVLLLLSGISLLMSRRLFHETRSQLSAYQTAASTQTLHSFINEQGINDCLLRAIDRHLWPELAAFALKLDKLHIPPAIEPQWPNRYPSWFSLAAHRPAGMMLFCTPATYARLAQTTPLPVIVRTAQYILLWKPINALPDGTYAFEWLPMFALSYHGFSEPDYNPQQESYRWASNAESRLIIPLEAGQPYALTITAAIPAQVTALQVIVHDQVLTTIRPVEQWRWQEFTIELPAQRVTTITPLTFRYEFTKSPRDFHTHNRHGFSVAFQRMTVTKHH